MTDETQCEYNRSASVHSDQSLLQQGMLNLTAEP
jgi:hypothetical protein